MSFIIGSVDSNDIMLEFNGYNECKIVNMAADIDDEIVVEYVDAFLKQFKLDKLCPTVYFNGANSWVIKSRCEAAAEIMGSK